MTVTTPGRAPEPDREPNAAAEETVDQQHTTPLLAELHLADLVADAAGEIVLFNDSRLPTLVLVSAVAVVGRGTVARHRTVSGEDVSGFRYVRFEDGRVLYYPADTELLIRTPR